MFQASDTTPWNTMRQCWQKYIRKTAARLFLLIPPAYKSCVPSLPIQRNRTYESKTLRLTVTLNMVPMAPDVQHLRQGLGL